MTDIQRDAYADSSKVYSDAIGVLPRNNRNHQKKQDIILDRTSATEGDCVLEVGCGHGLHAPRYADRFEYTGIDLSESLVREAQARIEGGTVKQADATNLPYNSDTFDAVVGSAILHHLPRQDDALSEWIRVTKPNGSVSLMEPNYLFPKAFLSAHLAEEERNKTSFAPWRLLEILDDVEDTTGVTCDLEPHLYTPPWPQTLAPMFNRLDEAGQRIPGGRWFSQMFLIHICV